MLKSMPDQTEFSSGGSGEKSASKFVLAIGRSELLVVVGWKSPFPCWLSSGNHCQLLEATHVPRQGLCLEASKLCCSPASISDCLCLWLLDSGSCRSGAPRNLPALGQLTGTLLCLQNPSLAVTRQCLAEYLGEGVFTVRSGVVGGIFGFCLPQETPVIRACGFIWEHGFLTWKHTQSTSKKQST